MAESQPEKGLVTCNNARLYYEVAGEGQPFVMIHAGVADNRQWNNEFAHFANRYRVLRYDLRGFGQSEPVEGEYNHLQDLTALLDSLHMDQPLILMGCSMGGSLAMDYALTYPHKVKALIMAASAPSGLQLDLPVSPELEKAEQAYNQGDLDLVAEIEISFWFDGLGRTPAQVDPAMRQMAYEMNRLALQHEAKNLGKRLPNSQIPAADHLSELHIPVLIVLGEHDTSYSTAAAQYMLERISSAQKVVIQDAAHLPNMEHPAEFQRIVGTFLNKNSL
jgi:3-oxoadipate enol-lactonase